MIQYYTDLHLAEVLLNKDQYLDAYVDECQKELNKRESLLGL